MTLFGEKAAYVRQATEHDGTHGCHWPGCEDRVPPAKWGCAKHWFALPPELRKRVWATYRPGQEISKTPSAAYVAVAKDVQQWIANHLAPKGEHQGSLL